jgi:hypothetical protein
MSRMDILTQEEIDAINRSSQLVTKYSKVVDPESAAEMLEKKIQAAEQRRSDAEARKADERSAGRSSGRTGGRTTGSSARRRTATHPVVKVLTSATFIRGVMGILTKAMKK